MCRLVWTPAGAEGPEPLAGTAEAVLAPVGLAGADGVEPAGTWAGVADVDAGAGAGEAEGAGAAVLTLLEGVGLGDGGDVGAGEGVPDERARRVEVWRSWARAFAVPSKALRTGPATVHVVAGTDARGGAGRTAWRRARSARRAWAATTRAWAPVPART